MKTDVATQAYEYIKHRILTFQLSPGVKISDEEIARRLGSSRTPVREALQRLAEQGLVEARPHRGFVVKVFSRHEVRDHYVLRECLESLAVRLAARNADEQTLQALRDLLETYPALMEDQDLVRFNDADEQFHDRIALASGNEVLYQTLRQLQGKIRIIRRYDHLRSSSFQETYEEHREILEALAKRQGGRARRAMSRHILNSMKVVMKLLPD